MGGFFIAGALAWLAELALCIARGFGWFLRYYELLLYAVAALWLPALLWSLGLGADRLSRAPSALRRGVVIVGSVALGAAGVWAGVLLTEGRRARDWGGRWWLVAGLALALTCALPAALWSARWLRARVVRQKVALVVLPAAALALGAVDLWVLSRSYPAFHWLLTLGSLGAFATLGAALRRPRTEFRNGLLSRGALVAAALGLAGLAGLSSSANAGYATEMAAPWTGKWLRAVAGLPVASRALLARGSELPASSPAPVRKAGPGIDLRDTDLLLITVDALRADALGAYGGAVGTPAMDALAAEGMVFERAYTPTPHTSYALSSMLTGKPLREVMALSEGASDHGTLPDSLRRFGYRTAAFYPPAIFFVDGARFSALSGRNFGFEYLKRMYASARDRVGQVQRYLGEVDPSKPVFVWVHLFEPHEPYDAPEGEPESELPRHRYEAEVRYVDRAVGDLTRAFRAARPGATVVLSADHGEEFGDHGGLYHGTTLFDEQARVPLIWSSPGVVRPGRTHAPVELHDLATTLLAAAGIARDARMRGDDLGPLLAGRGQGPAFAFATVDDRAMVVDGRHKAICETGSSRCRLYDLERDPAERRNLAGEDDVLLQRLRGALVDHLGSIARMEAVPLADGVGFPEALAQARLGAPGVGPDLVPLLSASEPALRGEAARMLGELRHEGARVALARLREDDPDPAVRREAALAGCALGDPASCDAALVALDSSDVPLARRAARVLALGSRDEGVPVLIDWALDAQAQERDRLEAVRLLRALGARAAEPALIELLAQVRLRPPAAEALGELGSRRGADALAAQLADERYPPARAAEARALLALGDRRAVPLLERMLGTESGVPGGVQLLVEAGALSARPTPRGAQVRQGSAALVGEWSCDDGDAGCQPGSGAALRLPAARERGPMRWVVWTRADGAQALRLAGSAVRVGAGDGQVSVVLPDAPREVPIEAQGPVWLRGVLRVPSTEDIAPPPPEPWGDDGAGEGARQEAAARR